MRPDLTSREKTPSEERWDPPDGCGTEPPGTCSGRKPPTCGEWGKTLQSPSEAHQKSQARRTPYTGSECGKAFGRSAHLAQHRGVHTGAKPHACMECGKAFGRLTHLSQHRGVHTGEKPYACGECGKASRRSTRLSRRGWTHAGQRPCTCDACGQALSQSARLSQRRCVHAAEKPRGPRCAAVRHLRARCGRSPARPGRAARPWRRAPACRGATRAGEPCRCGGGGKAFGRSSPARFTCASTPAPSRGQRPPVTRAPPARRGAGQEPEFQKSRDSWAGDWRGPKPQGLPGRMWGCGGSASLRAAEGGSPGRPAKLPEAPGRPPPPTRGHLSTAESGGAGPGSQASGAPRCSGGRRPHTPARLPALPGPLLCLWGLPRPPTAHALLSPPAAAQLPGQPGGCLFHEALSDPQPLWHFPCPEGALVPAQHPFLPAHSQHGPPVVRLSVLPPLLHLHRHHRRRARISGPRDSSRGSPS